jgi:hypothetical protein
LSIISVTSQFKDFDQLNKEIICTEGPLYLLGTMKKNPHEYEMPRSNEFHILRFDADNALPVKIGVSSEEGKEPTPVHLEAHRVILKIGFFSKFSFRENAQNRTWGQLDTNFKAY